MNVVLEVQDGYISAETLFGHVDKKLKEELENGKVSSQ